MLLSAKTINRYIREGCRVTANVPGIGRDVPIEAARADCFHYEKIAVRAVGEKKFINLMDCSSVKVEDAEQVQRS
jgi:hypothetical protein